MNIDSPSYNNHVAEGLYKEVVKQLITLLQGISLEDVIYKDFTWETNIHMGNFTYKCKDNGTEYEIIMISEVMSHSCGTKSCAMGNHYIRAADAVSVTQPKNQS
jgi:hypothetical protein